MKVNFSCTPDEATKLKKVIADKNIATFMDEVFTGKYNIIRFDFPYFDLNKLIAISEYLGTAPNLPYFFVDNITNIN